MSGEIMNQRVSSIAIVVFSVLFVLLLTQFVTSIVWGRWFVVRHDDVTYNVVSTGGCLVFQRAHLAYPPIGTGWSCARGACASGEYGPVTPSSSFEDLGLVDTVIRIPWEVNGSPASASTIQATGRSIAFPVWPLLVVTGYPPLKRLSDRQRLRRRAKQRGFEVTVARE